MTDTTDLSALRAAPGVVVHDAPGMSQSEEKALWDAFYEAQQALEAAQWPLIVQVPLPNGQVGLRCPWCDSDLGLLGVEHDYPEVHRVAVGLVTSGVYDIALQPQRPGWLEPEYSTRMQDSGEGGDDVEVGFSCDQCDHAVRIPGEVTW